MVRCIWFFGNLFDDSSGSFHYCDHPYSGAVLPVQRSYINARERLRLRWTKQNKSKRSKNQQKERDVNWWPEKCLRTVNQELISYTYPQGNEDGLVWCSRICAKSQRERHSATKKKGKMEKKKRIQVSGILPKKQLWAAGYTQPSVHLENNSMNVFATLLRSTRSMARAGCHPTGLLPTFAPIRSSLPSPNTSVGQNPPRGPSVGASHIPYPASLPAMGWAELGRILLTPTKGKTVVSFRAKSCRYLGCNSQFGEVSGKS